MKIIVGKKSGFCYGVRNAVEKTEEELRNTTEPIYCLGELVHNETVLQELKNKGLTMINTIADARGKTIIRAHGVPNEIYQEAHQRNIELVDLTCPSVLKIHEIANEYKNKGYYIFLIGKKNHPETIGTISFCGKNSMVIEGGEEVAKALQRLNATDCRKAVVLSQTTFSVQKFNEIVQKMKQILADDDRLEIRNTICAATELRQKETEKIAKQADAMIVIGGKHSSNTMKLYEICSECCEKVFFIQDENELQKQDIVQYKTIGIVAGASTPQSAINKVIHKLEK